MHPRIAVLVALGVFTFGEMPLHAQPRGRSQQNRWLSSLADGKAEARKTGKPLMVVLRCEP